MTYDKHEEEYKIIIHNTA